MPTKNPPARMFFRPKRPPFWWPRDDDGEFAWVGVQDEDGSWTVEPGPLLDVESRHWARQELRSQYTNTQFKYERGQK